MKIVVDGMMHPEEVGAAAVDFMYFSGYVTFTYLWTWIAKTALDQHENEPSDFAFYEAKIKTAQFYFKKILPRTQMHVEIIKGGLDVLMRHREDEFIF